MSMDKGLPDLDQLRQAIVSYIAGYAGAAGRRILPGQYDPYHGRPLIVSEPGGVVVNTTAGWFHSYTPFLVLSLLHLLEVRILNSAEVVAWITRQQRPVGYFGGERGGHALGQFADESTYHACVLLRWLGAGHDEQGWRRQKLVERLRALEGQGKRFLFGHLPTCSAITCPDPEHTFHAVACLAALDETVPDPEAAVRYIQSKQEAHGAFSIGWVRFYRDVPDVWDTLAAVRSLALLGAAPRDPDACVRAMRGWQFSDGGITREKWVVPELAQVSNGWETGATLVALNLLGGRLPEPDGCRAFLSRLWSPEEKGFHTVPYAGPGTNLISTYWGVLGTAALGLLGPARPHWRDLFLFSYR